MGVVQTLELEAASGLLSTNKCTVRIIRANQLHRAAKRLPLQRTSESGLVVEAAFAATKVTRDVATLAAIANQPQTVRLPVRKKVTVNKV